MTSAPYSPASNGLAERAVQTIKVGVKKMSRPLEVRNERFLFKYRVTPQATTGLALAELLVGRRLCTNLDLLYPSVKDKVQTKQTCQKERGDGHTHTWKFKIGDQVMA